MQCDITNDSSKWHLVLNPQSWWRHQMETFSALLTLFAGNSPVTSEFPAQRPVTGGFEVFFDLCPNKQLSKHSRGWWFETLASSLWRHCFILEFRPRHTCVWKVYPLTYTANLVFQGVSGSTMHSTSTFVNRVCNINRSVDPPWVRLAPRMAYIDSVGD